MLYTCRSICLYGYLYLPRAPLRYLRAWAWWWDRKGALRVPIVVCSTCVVICAYTAMLRVPLPPPVGAYMS